jgi:AcrR family transcriptional regulator
MSLDPSIRVEPVTARTGPRVRRGTAAGLLRSAAAELFAERGYHRTTTREIAEKAGVSPDLIYRYFGTKDNLFVEAVLNPLLDAVEEHHRLWVSEPRPDTRDPEDLIGRFTNGFSAFMKRNESIARAMIHVFADQAAEGELDGIRHRIAESIAPMVSTVDSYLSAHGLSHNDVGLKVRVTMVLIGAVVLFLPRTYATDAETPSHEALVNEITQFVLYGYRWGPRPPA